jgi:arylsulfatase A-like enzyme
MGGITEIATGSPGYSSVLPNSISPLARTLKLNGYSTAQFGKCHEVPVWETSPVGPFDAWPTGGGGFEYFLFRDSSDGRSYCLIQKCSRASRALPHLNAPEPLSLCQPTFDRNG